MRRLHLTLATLAGMLAPGIVSAQTSYPMITRVTPTAVQKGESVELTIAGGGKFDGAWQLLCQEPGLSGKVLEGNAGSGPGSKLNRGRGGRQTGMAKAVLTVAPDAPLGPREIRIATPQGVSSVGLVVVVSDPVVNESNDVANDRPDGAQALELPVAISGVIGKTEDVDWYSFSAKAGQQVSFSVWANRLENKIHDLQTHFDPIIAIHDAQGRELAVNDNHDFADPLVTYQFKEAGEYKLQIRDTTYTGNPNWTYVLHATAGPVATSVFPLAVNPGTKASFEARGSQLDPAQKTLPLDVPNLTPGVHLLSLPTAHGSTLPVPLLSTTLPLAEEKEDAPAEIEKAEVVSLPVALSGRLLEPNDVDGFRFDAKKGQIFNFEVFARRVGTATDPVVRVVNLKGATQAEADDVPGSKDPRLEWKAPADGQYAVQVQDLHSRGGVEFGYVLQAEPAVPRFTLTCDPDKLNLGPGARVPFFIQVTRHAGFNGPVTITWDDLPAGVTASPLTIPANMTQGVSVVSASADAKPAAALLQVTGRAEIDGGEPLVVPVAPKQEIYLPGGGRGVYPVQTLALAVTDESDITVEATPSALTLAPGKTAEVDVTVTRHRGYSKGVNLAILLQHLGGTHANPLPPGVTLKEAGSKTLLGPNETRGKLILEAKPDALPCENVPFTVMGHVSINFVVKTAYSSAPILLSIPPKEGAAAK